MAKTGRPTKCTPGLAAELCKHLRDGVPFRIAAEVVGVDEKTVRRWIYRGKAEPEVEPYASFSVEARRARAEGMHKWATLARKQALDGDGAMLRFILERQYPSVWGEKIQLRVQEALEGEVDAVIDRVMSHFATRPELLSEILGVIAGDEGEGEAQSAPAVH